MQLADLHGFPVISIIDTPGAYPGVAAEQHGQGGAIAASQAAMARLTVPAVACVIGEGGSGGAIAIALADRVLMQEHAIYSVISPEGCASILWRDPSYAPQAAENLGLTSGTLKRLGLVDEVVPEPLGGAHRNPSEMATTLKGYLLKALHRLRGLSVPELLDQRYQKFRRMGLYEER
jgi:acetyl-CoA carboxylase carboxyl transferase subunit alpha